MYKEQPCDEKYCKDFREALNEMTGQEKPVKLGKCGHCGIPVCDLHSIAMIMWFDDDADDSNHTKTKHELRYDPAICARCNWIDDNKGNHSRPKGWVGSRSKIPW